MQITTFVVGHPPFLGETYEITKDKVLNKDFAPPKVKGELSLMLMRTCGWHVYQFSQVHIIIVMVETGLELWRILSLCDEE